MEEYEESRDPNSTFYGAIPDLDDIIEDTLLGGDGYPWTEYEDAILIRYWGAAGVTMSHIQDALPCYRSKKSIHIRVRKLKAADLIRRKLWRPRRRTVMDLKQNQNLQPD